MKEAKTMKVAVRAILHNKEKNYDRYESKSILPVR